MKIKDILQITDFDKLTEGKASHWTDANISNQLKLVKNKPVSYDTFQKKIIAKFPDGPVVDTLHVLERMDERWISESALIHLLNEAAKHYADKLRNMKQEEFTVKQNMKTGNFRGGIGIVLQKGAFKGGQSKYTIATVHPNKLVTRLPLDKVLFIPPLTPKEEKNYINIHKQHIQETQLDKTTPTVGELAEKYHTSLLAVKQQLARGIRVEMEHTTKRAVAQEIALDHLSEDLFYYKKLKRIEKKK